MKELALVGDIGGTNARLALVEEGNTNLHDVHTLACRDFGNIDEAIEAYLNMAGSGPVARACLAIASPLQGDEVHMTNNHWAFSTRAVKARLGLAQLTLVNDFTAMALGMLEVPPADLITVNAGLPVPNAPCLVMGPGTGLGTSALIPAGRHWVPLAAEGGHVSFAPTDDLEIAVLQHLSARFGRVSIERILSGQGIVNLYRAIAAYRHTPAALQDAAQITEAALHGDPLAEESLQRFCRILGDVAGDAVLTLGARGGVYLCGGILPRIQTYFMHSGFRARFESKGRYQNYLAQVPVYLCTSLYPGLMGAAAALNNPLLPGAQQAAEGSTND